MALTTSNSFAPRLGSMRSQPVWMASLCPCVRSLGQVTCHLKRTRTSPPRSRCGDCRVLRSLRRCLATSMDSHAFRPGPPSATTTQAEGNWTDIRCELCEQVRGDGSQRCKLGGSAEFTIQAKLRGSLSCSILSFVYCDWNLLWHGWTMQAMDEFGNLCGEGGARSGLQMKMPMKSCKRQSEVRLRRPCKRTCAPA